jgi:hypothetical protein
MSIDTVLYLIFGAISFGMLAFWYFEPPRGKR